MTFLKSTGSARISFSSLPSVRPSEEKPRVPTSTTLFGEFFRTTGITWSAYDLIASQLTPFGSLAIS